MIMRLKNELKQLGDTAKQKFREWIVGGISLALLFVLYSFRDYVSHLRISIQTTPIRLWHIEEILPVSVLFLLLASFFYLLGHVVRRKKTFADSPVKPIIAIKDIQQAMKNGEKELTDARMKILKYLSKGEKEILENFIRMNKKTIGFPSFAKVVDLDELVKRGVITKSNKYFGYGGIDLSDIPYTIDDWAWQYLKDNPELLK